MNNIEEQAIELLQSPLCKQVNAALLYSELLHFNRTIDWSRVNRAIVGKWSASGLEKVKVMAWQLVEGRHLKISQNTSKLTDGMFTSDINKATLDISGVHHYLQSSWHTKDIIDLLFAELIPDALEKAVATGNQQVVEYGSGDNMYAMYALPDRHFVFVPHWILGDKCTFVSRDYLLGFGSKK